MPRVSELEDARVALIAAVVQREEFATDGQWLADAITRYEKAVRADEALVIAKLARDTAAAFDDATRESLNGFADSLHVIKGVKPDAHL